MLWREHAICNGLHGAQIRTAFQNVGLGGFDITFTDKFSKFPGGMAVYLYHRERDHRAKILCETPEKSGQQWYSCLGTNSLETWRDGNMLYLCRPRPQSPSHVWASLEFSTIESR